MPVKAVPVSGKKDWPVASLADCQVNRPGRAWCERDGHDFAALAGNHQSAVAALDAHRLNVGAGGFGDPQPV
jgi:hypothetical protein